MTWTSTMSLPICSTKNFWGTMLTKTPILSIAEACGMATKPTIKQKHKVFSILRNITNPLIFLLSCNNHHCVKTPLPRGYDPKEKAFFRLRQECHQANKNKQYGIWLSRQEAPGDSRLKKKGGP
jgi:hypothetical protein